MYKIYLDLDGVLVDFDSGIREYSGINYVNSDVIEGVFRTKHFKENQDFWYRLNPLHGYDLIYKYARKYDCYVLSSCSNFGEKCACAKKKWVKKHLEGFKEENILVVQDKKYKCLYAGERNILIDDHKKNIRQWEENGGIGIFYKNHNQVIKELDEICQTI